LACKTVVFTDRFACMHDSFTFAPLLLLLSLLLGLATACTAEQPSSSAIPALSTAASPGPTRSADAARYWSMTFDARRAPEPADLDRLRALGTTHLTLIPFGFQERIDTPAIRMNTDARWYSESDAGIRTLATQARDRGMGLILKPHLWVGRYSAEGQTRDQIGFSTEADWAAWEADYRRFMLHYAALAADVQADVLVIGTELARAAHERPTFWRGLIAEVRTVYDGSLTYAANWYDEYETLPFWDALDYIGVQAYFPLTDRPEPAPVNVLMEAWDEPVETLVSLAATADRPILFTEIGYRSVAYAAERPWAWPEREEASREPAAEALQAALYQAFFERFAEAPWFAGAVLWKWHPSADRARPLGFSPQGKAAEAVIRSGFHRAR